MIPARRLSRLLILLPSTRMGGTERHTADLAIRLAQRTGLQVHLAAAPSLLRHLPAVVTTHPADLDWEAPDAAARQSDAARGLIATLCPDAAFVPLPWPDAAPGILPALAEAALPRLVLLHLAGKAPSAAPPAGLDGAVIAAVSLPVARRAEATWSLPPGRIAVLPNPAPPPPKADRAVSRAAIRSGLGLPPGAPLLLFLGRLEEAKGADLLPAIADRLPFHLAIAGDGPLRGLLEARAAGDPRGLMRVLGPLADPSPWLLAADALLLPSRLEGAPLVFLEAAAHRCPVVATAAALEALDDAAQFAAIAGTPDPPGLAAAAEATLADPATTTARTLRAAAFAARHTPDRALTETMSLLRATFLRLPEAFAA